MLERFEYTKKAAEIDLALLKSANCALRLRLFHAHVNSSSYISLVSFATGLVLWAQSPANRAVSAASAAAVVAIVAAADFDVDADTAVELPGCHLQQRD